MVSRSLPLVCALACLGSVALVFSQQNEGEPKAKMTEEQMMSRSSDGLTAVENPDGSTTIDLQGRFQSMTIARINGNGQIETRCVTSIEERDAFLAGAGQTPTAER